MQATTKTVVMEMDKTGKIVQKITLIKSGEVFIVNTVTISLADVLDMSGMNVFNSGTAGYTAGTTSLAATESRRQVLIDGGAVDTVTISGGGFTNAGTVVIGGTTYDVWNSGGANQAQLLVNDSVIVA